MHRVIADRAALCSIYAFANEKRRNALKQVELTNETVSAGCVTLSVLIQTEWHGYC